GGGGGPRAGRPPLPGSSGLPEGELPGAQRREQRDFVVPPATCDREGLLAAVVPSRRVGEVERARELRQEKGAQVPVPRPDQPDRLLEEADVGPVDGARLHAGRTGES